MPPIIRSTPSPTAFADAWTSKVVEPAARKLAGRDGRLTEREVGRADQVLTGTEKLAAEAIRRARELTGSARPTVADVVAAERQRALESAADAAGSNRRLSWVEARALPRDLADGYAFLRGREAPPSPSPSTGSDTGIVSDIDKTVLPPHTGTTLPAAYPGVAALFREIEALDGDGGDTHYVTARNPDRVAPVRPWIAANGLPEGTIDTGTSALPWVAEPEKIADIKRLFDASPGKKFVLFGDTSHRDPEVYRAIRDAYPDRVLAVVIHDVKTINASRVDGMNVVSHYAEAAAVLFKGGVLSEDAARRVVDAARADGLPITDAQVTALFRG